VKKSRQPERAHPFWLEFVHEALDQHAMLRHRERVCAFRLAVPARDSSQAVRDVFDLDIERGGIEQIEPAPAQHALPSARFHELALRRHHAAFALLSFPFDNRGPTRARTP
jgi:hypothetical protein